MGQEALPCIVCNKRLRNCDPEWLHNQPVDGTTCRTYGNYGSTVFDPLDHSFLTFSVCDECLREKGRAGKVSWNREHNNVTTTWPIVYEIGGVKKLSHLARSIIGRIACDRNPVTWNPDESYEEEPIHFDIEEILSGAFDDKIEYTMEPEKLKEGLRLALEEEAAFEREQGLQ